MQNKLVKAKFYFYLYFFQRRPFNLTENLSNLSRPHALVAIVLTFTSLVPVTKVLKMWAQELGFSIPFGLSRAL